MKLASFIVDGKPGIGVLNGKQISNLSAAGFSTSMRSFLEAGPDVWHKALARLEQGKVSVVEYDAVRLLSPVPNPSKVVAIGLNYKDHAREQRAALPSAPLIFAKFPSSVIGAFDDITWDPALTTEVDYEVELGVVIGKRTRRVSEADALDFVFGYTVINDVSARNLQFGDKQWVRGKSLDTFCPVGPVIVTTDEIPDPQDLDVRCLVNDKVMQTSNTEQMVFGVRELVAYCSQAFTLEPGDLIATGTPGGVGVFREPPFFLKDGDVVVTEVENVGRMRNVVRL